MLNDARARSVRYAKKATNAIRSDPQCTAAIEAKNLSIASKNDWNESPAASGGCTGLRLSGRGQAHDYRERCLRAGPVHPHDVRTCGAHEEAEGERDEDRVVELTDGRDEVGNEVDRHREISRHEHHHGLVPARHARVS